MTPGIQNALLFYLAISPIAYTLLGCWIWHRASLRQSPIPAIPRPIETTPEPEPEKPRRRL
jgi:hypothetical protein